MIAPDAPPLPREMVERFRDRSDRLQVLQEALNAALAGDSAGIPILERAMWALEDALGRVVDEARAELEAAQSSGDSAAEELAQAALVRMLHASHITAYRFRELDQYLSRRAGARS